MAMKMKKKSPNVVITSTSSSSNNGVQVFHDKGNASPDHHWDFLDEMEAPMWVDLSLESKFAYEDKDNEWFEISHQFHQLSSRELIAAFSSASEGCTKLDLGIEGKSSPKLPTSVSRSRGKNKKCRELGKEKHIPTLTKRHAVKDLSRKISAVNFGSDKARKVKEQTNSKSTSDGEISLTEGAGGNSLTSVSNSADLKNYATSDLPSSTITSEDAMRQQQQRKSMEVSSHVHGVTSGLLSVLKVTLRKSCATRQASRCEVNRGRQSEGRKSSLSKSSVGSSSNPGGYEGKNLTARLSKDTTPESRNLMRMSHAPNGKASVANVSKEPLSNSNGAKESFPSLHINKESIETEVRHHGRRTNVLVPRKANEYNIPTNAAVAKPKEVKAGAWNSRFARDGKENEAARTKTAVQKPSSKHKHPTAVTKGKERAHAGGQCSGTLGGSKVNAERRTAPTQKVSTLEKVAKGSVQPQYITKRRGFQKSKIEKSVAPEERRIGTKVEGGQYANITAKVYLR